MYKFGAGFNPCFLGASESSSLTIPDFISVVELGLAEYPLWCFKNNKQQLSLHLSRTPICENSHKQDTFINFLKQKIFDEVKLSSKILSIGLHLIGDRYSGIGRFGFSTHFKTTHQNISQAIRFITLLSETFQIPVWLENANFYSTSSSEILETWESISFILAQTNARLILDLSHLLIDSLNNRILPEIVLGAIPRKSISEVHLSGVIQSKDGIYHDGHSVPVPSIVWTLFYRLLSDIIINPTEIVFTIEHTDPRWINKKEVFYADFKKLLNFVLNKPLLNSHDLQKNSETYAKNYLKKLLNGWCKEEISQLNIRGIEFDSVFEEWINYATKNDRKIALTFEEVPKEEWDSVSFAKKSFKEFIREMNDAYRN